LLSATPHSVVVVAPKAKLRDAFRIRFTDAFRRQPFRLCSEGLFRSYRLPFTTPRMTRRHAVVFTSFRRAYALSFTFFGFALATRAEPASPRFLIEEFRVQGVHTVKPEEVEESVYPFLGPERTAEDVERARLAVEALYRSKGYQAAFVQVPAQDAAAGVVLIQVTEGVIGRTRVTGARFSSPRQLKADAPSLAEGQPINFNHVSRDLARLNQVTDRRVTPALRAGIEPGTIDVELQVEESKAPLATNAELNNRNSAFTSDLRLNGGVSYGNLFQRGHTLGFSYQIAPQDIDDAKVFSGYYLFRPAAYENLTLQLLATKQDSNVSTLGGSAVAGRGETFGARAIFALPGDSAFYHTLSTGLDYKNLKQDLKAGGSISRSPVEYLVASATYGATWLSPKSSTELSLTPSLGLRGIGSDDRTFDTRRFGASGSFIYLRSELARTQKIFAGIELYARGQAQLAGQPLVDSEQFSGGGLDTVRGYFESEVAGDDAIAGTLELRSPSLLGLFGRKAWGEWRVHTFIEGAILKLQEPLPAQDARFHLASAGVGTRVQLRKHFNGSIDAGWPFLSEGQTEAGDLRINFSIGATY
jgi:hemolysin activation/secretion protein